MLEFRRATPDDCDALARIRAEFLAEANGVENDNEKATLETLNRQFMSTAMVDGSFAAWVAAEEGEIVATSGISFYTLPSNKSNPSGKTAYISNMFTYPAWRKQGIAARLFELVVSDAAERGCGKVMLNATEMGRPIYERFGFKSDAGDMNYYL